MEPFPSCFCDACLALTYAGSYPHDHARRALHARVAARRPLHLPGHDQSLPGGEPKPDEDSRAGDDEDAHREVLAVPDVPSSARLDGDRDRSPDGALPDADSEYLGPGQESGALARNWRFVPRRPRRRA